MTNIDQFENLFKEADKPGLVLELDDLYVLLFLR
jgi:hypothetical protein